MRSDRGGAAQLSLWEAEQPRRARRRAASSLVTPENFWTVTGDEFASQGWPAGTVLHLEPVTRADRGALVVVRQGERSMVGFFGLDRGRPALLTDRGSTWLGEQARVVAVVTAVEAPLAFSDPT